MSVACRMATLSFVAVRRTPSRGWPILSRGFAKRWDSIFSTQQC
jgi:hypothetical protein